jgi:hypothetical protein
MGLAFAFSFVFGLTFGLPRSWSYVLNGRAKAKIAQVSEVTLRAEAHPAAIVRRDRLKHTFGNPSPLSRHEASDNQRNG